MSAREDAEDIIRRHTEHLQAQPFECSADRLTRRIMRHARLLAPLDPGVSRELVTQAREIDPFTAARCKC